MRKVRPTSPDEIELTAYHEAGHVVVAYVNGARIFGVDVWTTEDGGVQGQSRLLANDEQTQLLVWLAGVQAESLRLGRNDRRHRDNLNTLYKEQHVPSDDQALEQAIELKKRIGSGPLDALRQRARDTLRHDCPRCKRSHECSIPRAIQDGAVHGAGVEQARPPHEIRVSQQQLQSDERPQAIANNCCGCDPKRSQQPGGVFRLLGDRGLLPVRRSRASRQPSAIVRDEREVGSEDASLSKVPPSTPAPWMSSSDGPFPRTS